MTKKKLKGVLLKRKFFSEYNDKLIFFTNTLGKVIFYSYGSKSPRSHRRALLAYPALLNVTYEKKGRFLHLLELERIALFWEKDSKEQNSFMKLLPHIDRHLPFYAKDETLFELLEYFAKPKIFAMPAKFLDLFFLGSLLQHLGILEANFLCNGCNKWCSESLILLRNKDFWSEECHHKRIRQKQKLSPVFITLSPYAMALIQTLNKLSTGHLNINAFYLMYKENFAKKQEYDWDITYKYLNFLSETT